MARLRAVVDSLDGIDESLRELYTEREDGKFALDAEGVEDVSGLKSALAKTKDELRKAKGRVPADFDPEKYEELLALQEEFQKGKLPEKQREEFDSLKQQLQEQHKKQTGQLEAKIERLQGALRKELVTARAASAIAAQKGSVRLLLPHVERYSNVLESDDGDFTPVVVDDKGHTRVNKDGEPMTYDELVAEMRASADFQGAFEGTGSSGGGASRSTAGGGSKTVVAAGDNSAFLANLEGIAKGEVEVR